MLYLPGGGAMLFLTDVDHVSFEKANETRKNNLQSATVSLQVVIDLCKRKETAALKIKAAVSNGRWTAPRQVDNWKNINFSCQ